MSEMKTDLSKIDPETAYAVGGKIVTADSETHAINDNHTIADILRYLVSVSSASELKYILDNLD